MYRPIPKTAQSKTNSHCAGTKGREEEKREGESEDERDPPEKNKMKNRKGTASLYAARMEKRIDSPTVRVCGSFFRLSYTLKNYEKNFQRNARAYSFSRSFTFPLYRHMSSLFARSHSLHLLSDYFRHSFRALFTLIMNIY